MLAGRKYWPFVVVVTTGDELQMENLILIVVSLGSLTRELFECLAVLVHWVHGLGWVVEHEGHVPVMRNLILFIVLCCLK